MNKRHFAFSLVFLLASVGAYGEGTRIWQQSKFDEFEKGTSHGVAIRSEGTLELAPAFKPLATTSSSYVWAIASDRQGNAYVAAGAPARVYQVTPDGKVTDIFESQEFQVQALVLDKNDTIYAATSPDGKVYKIEHNPGGGKKGSTKAAAAKSASGKSDSAEKKPAGADPAWTSSVLYDPKTKYIWALALDDAGQLYIATGDHGEIFRVDRQGQGALFFRSDEAHIRALALDPKGNLIAGSDGSGLVYRISPEGKAFVLYSAPKKEITALTVDEAGNIYAAGVGEKHGGGGGAGSPQQAQMPPPVPLTPGGPALPMQLPANFPVPGLGAVGSEVYQISPEGAPTRIWSSKEDMVYALAFNGQRQLVAGTGNKARLVSIRGAQQYTDLLKASATQVTGLAKAPNGGLYVATSNLGKVFLLGGVPGSEATYESDVFDAKTFSQWGRAEVRARGDFELWARSGNVDNPDRNWSPWTRVDLRKNESLAIPPARFVQWKAVLQPGTPAPSIDSVILNYLPKNVAPVIDEVVVQPSLRYQPSPKPTGPEFVQSNAQPAAKVEPPPPPAVRDHGTIGVRWSAHDDNDDELVFSLFYRGDGENNWKLLKDNLSDRFYSLDAGLLPDGGYTVKVLASDAPSNSPDSALTDERESEHFDVDTTAPSIEELNASLGTGGLHVTFRATDHFSDIKRAEYSVDAGEWQYIEPKVRISDALTENYDFVVALPEANSAAGGSAVAGKRKFPGGLAAEKPVAAPVNTAEHLIVVRVWDRFDNVATAKTVIRAK
jgi:sugar lactone lactonase YvrE